MRETDVQRGILGKAYATQRREKPQLAFRYKVRARIVANAARKYLGTSGPFRILDFGSAEGLALQELRSLLPFGTYVGVESSEELLHCIADLPSDMRIVKGDVASLPGYVKGELYDIVSALALLEHLPDPFMAVREAANVLRPGGIFVGTCPAPFWDKVAVRCRLLREGSHVTEMNKKNMISAVHKAGMEVLAYERFMWAPISFLPYLRAPIYPSFSLALDRIVRSVQVFNWLFVNQCIVARRG